MKDVKFTNSTQGNIQIIKVSGFMDMSKVFGFEHAMDSVIKKGHVKIVLDLSEVEYVSSAGLGAIVGRIREVRQHNGDIKIGGYSDLVHEILTTFGFTEVFEAYPSPEEAVKHFQD